VGRGLARTALVLAGITVLARLAGFARTLAFGRSVSASCVGSVYQTSNTIPNIVFDLVAGGMLSALVVPIMAPAFAAGDRDRAGRLASALLTWAVIVLVPIGVVIAAFAGPAVSLLMGTQPCPGAHALGVRMLLVFAPQVLFYGLAVVLGGVLSADERFTWPAVSPLLSSLVVVVAYLTYGHLAGPDVLPERLGRGAELVLSVGTTLGVVVLGLALVPAALRMGLRWRPAVRFPVGVAATVRVAALAGAATLTAQQLSSAVTIRLANSGTAVGTVVIVAVAQTVFLLPWAVLSLPVATTAFPRLAAAWDRGDTDEFRRRSGQGMRVVLAAAAGGTVLLVAVAEPAGIVLLSGNGGSLRAFAPTLVAWSIGLIGWSLVALLARTLYAAGRVRTAAAAQVAGQLTVIVADLVLSAFARPLYRGFVLGLGNSVGVTVAAVALLVLARRAGALRLGAATARAAGAAVTAALVGSVAGWSVGRLARGDGTWTALGIALLAAAAGAVVFAAAIAVLDRPLVRELRGRRPARARAAS
jgi:putative peptidoglycan lipid II flippase